MECRVCLNSTMVVSWELVSYRSSTGTPTLPSCSGLMQRGGLANKTEQPQIHLKLWLWLAKKRKLLPLCLSLPPLFYSQWGDGYHCMRIYSLYVMQSMKFQPTFRSHTGRIRGNRGIIQEGKTHLQGTGIGPHYAVGHGGKLEIIMVF